MDQFNVALDYVSCNYTAMYGEVGGNGLIPDPVDGDNKNESVQRVAGISFPEKKQLEEYHHFLAEAAKRNHRKIGADQKLFFFDPASPGSCFFLPHGTRIYNAMLDLLRQEYRRRGYDEVITPNMYKADLWKTSGHWDHYADGKSAFLLRLGYPIKRRPYRHVHL